MTNSASSKATGLFPAATHSNGGLDRSTEKQQQQPGMINDSGTCSLSQVGASAQSLFLFLGVSCVLSTPILCATAGSESSASAEERGNGAAERVAPLILTLVPAPELGLAVGETRDENDKLVDAYPFLLSTDDEASKAPAPPTDTVTESFKALVRSEEEARLDLLVKEEPAWLLFYFRELAVSQFVLKNVSNPQYGGLANELKTAELLKESDKAETCDSHRCKVTPLQTTSCVGEVLTIKRKLEEGDTSIGYFDVLQWMACPHMSHAFMNGYMELAGEFGAELTEGGASSRGRALVKKWLEEPAVQNNFEALIRDRRTWVTSSPITGAVWILKAAAAQSLLEALNPDRLEKPRYKRLADVLRLFLFHHQQLARLTEASLEKLVGGLILHYSDVCKVTDKGIECTQGPQLLTAPVDPEDPQFSVPDSLRTLTRPTIEGKTITGPQSVLHRARKGKKVESSALELFLENEEKLERGLLSLKAIQHFEQAVQWMSLIQLGGVSSSTESGNTFNPYLFCQTLWTRARELQSGSEAFAGKVEKWQDGGDKLGAVLLSLLQAQPKWGLPDAYAPLTSACMQTAGFLHSIVEEYDEKHATFKAIGRTIKRVGVALAKRLIGKRHRQALRPRTWVALEATMQPSSGVSVAQYRGALEVTVNLAKEFRRKFLDSNITAPVFLKQLTSLLLGMWAQRFRKTFSFEDNQISTARKAFVLAALLDKKGHVGYAVDLVLEAAERLPKAKALEFGRVSYLGNYGYQIGGAVVALSKRGRVKLTYSDLEDMFLEVAMTSDDPLDVIRTAIDLANTLLSLQESQKGAKVINDVAIMQTEAAIRYHCAGIERHLRLAAAKDLTKETPERYQDYLNAPKALVVRYGTKSQSPSSPLCPSSRRLPLPFGPSIPINHKLLYLFAEAREFKRGLFTQSASYFETAELPLELEGQVLDGEQLLPVTEASRTVVVNAGSVVMTYRTLKQLGYHGGISIRPRASSTTGGSQTR
ncbi:hypothetical protein Emed_004190 [Eimeria media]